MFIVTPILFWSYTMKFILNLIRKFDDMCKDAIEHGVDLIDAMNCDPYL